MNGNIQGKIYDIHHLGILKELVDMRLNAIISSLESEEGG